MVALRPQRGLALDHISGSRLTSAAVALAGMTFSEMEVSALTPFVVFLAPNLITRTRGRHSGRPRPPFQVLVLGSAILFALGSLASLALAVPVAGRLHGWLTLSLVALVIWWANSVDANALRTVALVAARIIVAVQAVCLALVQFGVGSLGAISLMYGGVRFKGLSENPNQLAIITLLALPILWSAGGRSRLWTLPCLAVGLASGSAGLRTSWLLGAGAALLLTRSARNVLRRRAAVALLAFTAAAWITVFGDPISAFERYANELIAQGPNEDGNGRLPLNRNGLRAVGASPLVGLGPGAHSGLTAPHQGVQAHSLPVDWLTQAGVLGGLVMIWALWRILYRNARESPDLMFAAVAFAAYAFSGFALRHPIVSVFLMTLYDRGCELAASRRFARDLAF